MGSRDLPAALALNNASLPELNELDQVELTRLLALACEALVVDVDGAFAGFCIVFPPLVEYASLNYRWFSGQYADFAYLDRIAVTPPARRLGVGRALYSTLIDRLRGRFPILCCEVNVRPRNEASLRFHQRIGFTEVGQQDTDGGSKTVSLLTMDLGLTH